ncbi:hypothetical protein ACI2KS_10465 [Pseudomonas sp. NPDC087358]|uniref:hypothetical protein n=1 Tax=Pseudomonas sp. NPDC087358 TaxID=3364439 RepID=UPI00384B2212
MTKLRPPYIGRLIDGWERFGVLPFDAACDVFELFGQVSNAYVVAPGEDASALDITRGDDPGRQQKESGLEAAPLQANSGRGA